MHNFLTILTILMDLSKNRKIMFHITSWKDDKYLFEINYKGINLFSFEIEKANIDDVKLDKAVEYIKNLIIYGLTYIENCVDSMSKNIEPTGWVFD